MAIGEKIREKGWKHASIDIGASYLAMFDCECSPTFDVPRYSASIRATVHHSDRNGDWSDGQQGYNASTRWGVETFHEALVQLEQLAEKMPRMADESARIKAAKSKLSDEEKRLLGVR